MYSAVYHKFVSFIDFSEHACTVTFQNYTFITVYFAWSPAVGILGWACAIQCPLQSIVAWHLKVVCNPCLFHTSALVPTPCGVEMHYMWCHVFLLGPVVHFLCRSAHSAPVCVLQKSVLVMWTQSVLFSECVCSSKLLKVLTAWNTANCSWPHQKCLNVFFRFLINNYLKESPIIYFSPHLSGHISFYMWDIANRHNFVIQTIPYNIYRYFQTANMGTLDKLDPKFKHLAKEK